MARTNRTSAIQEKRGRLRLNYAQVATELTVFKPLAKYCLTETSVQALDLWLETLRSTASCKTDRTQRVKTKAVLTTRPNGGQHQSESGISLLGEMEFTWDVIPEAPTAKLDAAKSFLIDNASIRLAICRECEAGAHDVVARWTFDIGNHESPGCHFHAKYESDSGERGTSIDIPRLPTMVVMPTDAMAFLFGELWQKQWAIALMTDLRDPATKWRSWSRDRLGAVLAAFSKCVEEDTGLVPWAAFKAYKPVSDLLLK